MKSIKSLSERPAYFSDVNLDSKIQTQPEKRRPIFTAKMQSNVRSQFATASSQMANPPRQIDEGNCSEVNNFHPVTENI